MHAVVGSKRPRSPIGAHVHAQSHKPASPKAHTLHAKVKDKTAPLKKVAPAPEEEEDKDDDAGDGGAAATAGAGGAAEEEHATAFMAPTAISRKVAAALKEVRDCRRAMVDELPEVYRMTITEAFDARATEARAALAAAAEKAGVRVWQVPHSVVNAINAGLKVERGHPDAMPHYVRYGESPDYRTITKKAIAAVFPTLSESHVREAAAQLMEAALKADPDLTPAAAAAGVRVRAAVARAAINALKAALDKHKKRITLEDAAPKGVKPYDIEMLPHDLHALPATIHTLSVRRRPAMAEYEATVRAHKERVAAVVPLLTAWMRRSGRVEDGAELPLSPEHMGGQRVRLLIGEEVERKLNFETVEAQVAAALDSYSDTASLRMDEVGVWLGKHSEAAAAKVVDRIAALPPTKVTPTIKMRKIAFHDPSKPRAPRGVRKAKKKKTREEHDEDSLQEDGDDDND